MTWSKQGLIFKADNVADWWISHTQSPIALLLNSDTIRIFVGSFDKNGKTRIGYLDLSSHDPKKIISVSEKPVLDLGEPGDFDGDGVFPASVYNHDGKIYLYYTGFQESKSIRYYMFGGLAISEDGGHSFSKVSRAPVTDRSDEALFFRGGPSVINEGEKFAVYYSGGSDWTTAGGKLRPCYDIFYNDSFNGINIPQTGTKCLEYDRNTEHGIGRPQIFKMGNTYQLYFCVRTLDMKYHLGYAESKDGKSWTRCDDKLGITHSKEGWDSEMVYFPTVLNAGTQHYLFYCGNDYGRDGLGYAVYT